MPKFLNRFRRQEPIPGVRPIAEPTANHTCLTNGDTTIVRIDEAPKSGDPYWQGDGPPARWYMWRHEGVHDTSGYGWSKDVLGIDPDPTCWTDRSTDWDFSVDYSPFRPGEPWRAEQIIREVTR